MKRFRDVWGRRGSQRARRFYRRLLLVNGPTALLVLSFVLVYTIVGLPTIVWTWLTVLIYGLFGVVMFLQARKAWHILSPPVIAVEEAKAARVVSQKRSSSGRNAKKRSKQNGNR